MKTVRILLGFIIAALLVTTRPAQPIAAKAAAPDAPATYRLRVEKGKSHRVRFQMIDPRGDSLIEADRFDLILTPRGLTVRPVAPITASSLSGARLNFETLELSLPIDGTPELVTGTVVE